MGFLEKPIVRDLLLLVFGLALGVLAHYLVRIHLLPRLQKLLRKTRIKWDDVLFEQGVFGAAALLIPLVVMFRVTPFLTVLQGGAMQLLKVVAVTVVAVGLDRLLRAGLVIYNTFPISVRLPIKGVVQILQIALWAFAGTIIFSQLLGQSPWIFLSGLGAVSAVLLVVFQDTILAFFAGLQLTLNDQVRVGTGSKCPSTTRTVQWWRWPCTT